ncbi:DMT family transporter [Burkholderia ambifaria]|nr:DMT family transporter [Burkholderia ambifaria]
MSLATTPEAGRQPGWLRVAPALFLLLWASGFVFLKLGLRDADPLTFLALRYACVVALLAGPFLWLRPALPRTRNEWRNLVVVGLLLQAGYFSFTYLSLKLGMTAGAVALVTSQQPILVGLLALACITGGTLWEKRFGTDIHPVTANLVQYTIGLAVTAPLAFALEPMHVHWTVGLAGSLAYLVICNSLIAISLLLAMVRYGEASRVSALFFLIPPAAALIALVVLGETIGTLAWSGMALAAGGLYLVMRY